MAGPRDWSPPETGSRVPESSSVCPPTRNAPPYSGRSFGATSFGGPSYRRPASIRSAWLSLLFGSGALMLAFIQPENSSTTRGFLASTIGITAVFYGVHALRNRIPGRMSTFLPAIVGLTGGVVGTFVMAIYLLAYFFVPTSTSFALPGIPIPPPASIAQEAPETPVTAPALAAFATPNEEAMALAQAVGTMDFVLRKSSQDGLYPDSLTVTTADGRVTAPSGVVLVALPPGTLFAYTVSADRTQ